MKKKDLVRDKEFAQKADNFFREDGVVLHPSEEENIRRIDVFIGDDEDEIKNTPIIHVTDKILKDLESLKGDHIANAAARQQTLFVEGVDF